MQKTTKIRTLTEQILRSQSEPIELAKLHRLVAHQYPRAAFSTIYRIAQRLESGGKIVRADWRERGSKYEWADRPHHHHITCSVCGSMKDIDDASITVHQELIRQQTQYSIGTHHFELEGICPACLKKRDSAAH